MKRGRNQSVTYSPPYMPPLRYVSTTRVVWYMDTGFYHIIVYVIGIRYTTFETPLFYSHGLPSCHGTRDNILGGSTTLAAISLYS